MKEEVIEKWKVLIRPLFPHKARIDSIMNSGGDLFIVIDWKLGNDPKRPNKLSKLLEIVISREALEDCKDYEKAGLRIVAFIKSNLVGFDPDHDHPKNVSPAKEKWIIKSDYLN